LLLDKTKSDISVPWYPSNYVINPEPYRGNDNGHPISGAVRDAARRAISAAIDSIGMRKFEINSAAKSSDDSKGAHPHVSPGDLAMDFHIDAPKQGDVVTCIDTDYYVCEWDKWLGGGNPAIFHTFQPTTVAGKDGECNFTIINDEVHYNVPGGGKWQHKIWDWSAFGEYVLFRTPSEQIQFGKLAGFFGFERRVIFKVHVARPWTNCPHRALVWLVPCYSFWHHVFLPTELLARSPSRVKFTDADRVGWNILVSPGDKGERVVDFGRQGQDAHVTIDKAQFDVLMSLGSEQSVTTRALQYGIKDTTELALIGQYYRRTTHNIQPIAEMARTQSVKVHWPLAMHADKPEVNYRAYSSPIVSDSNVAPMIKRWEALSTSIDRRITFVENKKLPGKKIEEFAHEFCHLIVTSPGSGHPMSLEETAAELSKPSQVLAVKRVWETLDVPHRRRIECFVKKEPTMKNGRIISSFPDARFLIGMSRYTLAFRRDVLHAEHNEHWFCPGLKPEEIARKLQEYCTAVTQPMEGDFSNLDGSTSAWAQRTVMNGPYFRHFHPSYHKEMQTYFDMLITCPAYAKAFGFKYEAGPGVRSGSPTTCDANTLENAFTMYCGIRLARPGFSKVECFQQIGLCFGDDSVFDQQYRAGWIRACEQVGLTLKVETCTPDKGVTFLARVFPDPWKTLTSFQDPLRTWRKAHMTGRDPHIPLGSAAIDRLKGYLVTDGLSPVMSQYANAVVAWYENQEGAETQDKRESRASVHSEKPYWLTTGGSWPQEEKDVELMRECAAARTGLSVEELRNMERRLAQMESPWDPFTIDRSEEPCPIQGGLDDDALPVVGLVDDRLTQNESRNANARAMQIAARLPPESGGDAEGVVSRDPEVRPSATHRGERLPSDARLLPEGRNNTPEDDRRSAVQTHRPQGAPSTSRGAPGRGRANATASGPAAIAAGARARNRTSDPKRGSRGGRRGR